ncbi:CoA ester lyase [Pandoraea sp. ISTKB]|uniref:HpcH/HpaI aldolase/citrate lyase family protein n=1 Tax=Pandoraea sp. ISTKB TaxID=1586708 RepID=UPI000846F0EE|nr:CoA ester lyase [Pandoraea sp. ISTKB]ODP31580.1 aldolase [Pandoraea sp. ISTKB]
MTSADSPRPASLGNAANLATAQTFLFAPGDRPERFEKALGYDADVVIIDWEASVIGANKAQARENTAAFVRNIDCRRVAIRLNPSTGDEFAHDLAALTRFHKRIAGVFLTMVNSADDLMAAAKALPASLPRVGMIETARGILNVESIIDTGKLCRVAFGNMDFQTALSLPPDQDVGLFYPSARMVLASAAAGLPAPIAGATENLADLQAFERSARFERNLGFLGKLCVHPTQLPIARAVFSPSTDEIAWAHRVIEATQRSHAVMMDGHMVDRPVVDRAKAILRRASHR